MGTAMNILLLRRLLARGERKKICKISKKSDNDEVFSLKIFIKKLLIATIEGEKILLKTTEHIFYTAYMHKIIRKTQKPAKPLDQRKNPKCSSPTTKRRKYDLL